jgi:hypothetical protein
MSIMDQISAFTWGPGVSYTDAMSMGANYTWGGDMRRTVNGGGTNTRIQTPTGGTIDYFHTPGVKSVYSASPTTGKLSGMQIFGIANSIPLTAMAFYQGGIQGGVHSMVQDIAIGGALARWGHEMRSWNGKAAGVTYGNLGRLKGVYETMSKHGPTGRTLAKAMAVGSFGSRLGGALVATSALDAVVGTGMLSNFLTPVAAGLGAKYSPYLLAGAVVAGGAYLAGKAGYSVLKAGYDYRQQGKSIQTSGDLMAFNTGAALTMRARAVQAMQNSHMNSRSALGQEAMFIHQPQRNYHSPYRAGF